MWVLHGCGAKNGEEIDGQEFEITNLYELINLIKTHKEIHLNYALSQTEDERRINGNVKEIDLDVWIQ